MMKSALQHETEFGWAPSGPSAKSLGAFYTDAQIADFLSWWAICSADDLVMDPSFGGGVFLRSACKRLTRLGSQLADQVFGIEIDPDVYTRIANKLSKEFGLRRSNLWLRSFFDAEPVGALLMDAVIGNPPFIRYQRFAGEMRQRALSQAEKQGVYLSELSSSWAPFLVHSVAWVKPGGRLAMVVPMEMAHAAYARPVVGYLSRSFRKVTFLTFRQRLFPNLSEDTFLLLADDRGPHTASFFVRELAYPGLLKDIQQRDQRSLTGVRRVNTRAVAGGQERLIEYLIPKRARELYRELGSSSSVQPLGALADVGIGYVTGANDFFHLQPHEVQQWEIPETFLRPAIRRSRALTGLRFKRQDWCEVLKTGDAGYLLYIEPNTDLPFSVRQYLQYGEARGVPQAYKCRTRTPWFCVPHVYHPDAFLTYMSGRTPRLVANEAGVVAPNSLHILRLRSSLPLKSNELAALWQTSLTRLSVEIEGHALGGGMLKLEPTEAEAIIIAWPQEKADRLAELEEELDLLLRQGAAAKAQARADKVILREGLGLSRDDCLLLQSAAETLRNRRYARSSST